MPLLLSFCYNEVLPLVNQPGKKPLSKKSFSCNLTLSWKLPKFFNQNPWTKSGPGDVQFGILPSISFKLPVVLSIFFCFFHINFIFHVLLPLCILRLICILTPYVSPKLFHIFLFLDLMPYKTAFDYCQIVYLAYLPSFDIF